MIAFLVINRFIKLLSKFKIKFKTSKKNCNFQPDGGEFLALLSFNLSPFNAIFITSWIAWSSTIEHFGKKFPGNNSTCFTELQYFLSHIISVMPLNTCTTLTLVNCCCLLCVSIVQNIQHMLVMLLYYVWKCAYKRILFRCKRMNLSCN